jgi:hypothetical protein
MICHSPIKAIHNPIFVNFMNTLLISISQFLTTLITLKNMGVKWKESNAFTPMLKLVNKNSKIVHDIMECIQCHTFGNWKTSQQGPPTNHQGITRIFEKQKHKKFMHCTNKNLANVLVSMNVTMCHVFLKTKLICFHSWNCCQIFHQIMQI